MTKGIILACAVLSAVTAQATIWGFSAPLLDGAQEVPPTKTTAYGTASYNIDDLTWDISGAVTITGLNVEEVIGLHIHHGPVGINGPIIFDILANTFSTSQSGDVSNWFFTGVLQNDPGGLTRNQKLAIMVAGDAYINAHTPKFPGGEIRGQIECVVPEPGTFVALGVGLSLCLALRRRR
jgi:hypothetical protein